MKLALSTQDTAKFFWKPIVYVCILIIAYQLFILFRSLDNPGIDFISYYDSTKRFFAEPSTLYATNSFAVDAFIYPPPSVLLFAPFTFMPIGMAYICFTLLMQFCILTASFVWLKNLKENGYQIEKGQSTAVLLLVQAAAPAYHNLLLGQVNGFILLLSVIYICNASRLPIIAGIALAIATWIKIYPLLLIFIPLLSFRKLYFKTITVYAISLLIIPLALLPFIPLHLYLSFAHKIQTVSNFVCANIVNQSLVAFLTRFTLDEVYLFKWPNLFPIHASIKIINILVLSAFLVWVAVVVRKVANEIENNSFMTLNAIVLGVCCIISPVAWGHTYVLAMPLVICVLVYKGNAGFMLYAARFMLISILLLFPVHSRLSVMNELPFWVTNMFYSRIFIMCVVMMILLLIQIGGSWRKATLP
jgi:hypothetical protein